MHGSTRWPPPSSPSPAPCARPCHASAAPTRPHEADRACDLTCTRAQLSVASLIVDAYVAGLPIVYASPAFERLTGYKQQDVWGKNCRCLQGKGTEVKPVHQLVAALRRGAAISVTLTNYKVSRPPNGHPQAQPLRPLNSAYAQVQPLSPLPSIGPTSALHPPSIHARGSARPPRFAHPLPLAPCPPSPPNPHSATPTLKSSPILLSSV